MNQVCISEKEIHSWLSAIFDQEIIENASVTILGNSEKGNGQCGEVIFVTITDTHKNTSDGEYNLAIKSSKSDTALMAQTPAIRDAFKNEIYFYQKIFPAFRKFQIDRGITNPFNSVPRYYGSYSDDVKDVIALENLKKNGYVMWDTCTPLTRKHIDLVVEEYSKFHAVSVAMKELQHEAYQHLKDGIVTDVFKKFFRSYSAVIYFKNAVEQLHELLKDDLDEDILKKWLGFKEQVHSICFDMAPSDDDLEVITHGDCWNNNFMYKYEGDDDDKSSVCEVAILDWQISRISSPVADLSYFLFACISEEDLAEIDHILTNYYEFFCDYLTQLGSTFKAKYSFNKFSEEWKKFSKLGVMMSVTLLKNSYIRRKNISDLVNKNDYKNRAKCIVTYAVKSDII
ncbi:hypothetical protein Zmor_021416 [Zophobas morio]|uniref:CHK kinase-like domain-containing protein n=1 Tax=Zophobas morio TaxID=2755281 RepID=A0AA38MAZ6_9CUCU|nr:hypothetical protein Zmor_021416 [Zophobas morio]